MTRIRVGQLTLMLVASCAKQPTAQPLAPSKPVTLTVAVPSATAATPMTPLDAAVPDERELAALTAELERRLTARFPDLVGTEIAVDAGMHQTDVKEVAVDEAETFAVTASDDKTARVWALNDGKLLTTLRFPGEGEFGALYAVSVSPRGNRVAFGGYAGDIFIYDSSNWHLVRKLEPKRGTVHELRFSRDGKRLAASFHRAHGFVVYETSDYTPKFETNDIDGDIYGLAFDAAGELAVAAWDRRVRVYSDRYRLLDEVEFSERPYRISFDRSGKHLVVGFVERPIARVLAVPTLRTEHELEPSTDSGEGSLAQSRTHKTAKPSSRAAATRSTDKTRSYAGSPISRRSTAGFCTAIHPKGYSL